MQRIKLLHKKIYKYFLIFFIFENWEIFIYRKQNKNKNLNFIAKWKKEITLKI